jgi:hypothetical protein
VSNPTAQQNWPPETPLTPEQAAIAEAAYTLKYQEQIAKGTMPPIPGASNNPLLQGAKGTPGNL